HRRGLVGLEAVLVELLVAADEQQVLGVRRPRQLALEAVAVGEHLARLAALVADPDLFAAALVADVGDPLAVGRPARLPVAGGRPRGAGVAVRRCVSPRSVVMLNSSPCVEITARLPLGETWKASHSPLTVTVSTLLSRSSVMRLTLTSRVWPLATSSFQRPKF